MSSYQLNVSGSYAVNASSFSLSAPLAVTSGGTGASNSSDALSNLGAQPRSQYLVDIAGSEPSNGQYIQFNGDNYVAANGPPSYLAGSGLTLTDTTFAVSVDGVSLDISGSNIEVMAGGINSSKLASNAVVAGKIDASAIGDGLQILGGAVMVDGSVLRATDDTIVRTSGSYALSGTLTLQASQINQVSGQGSYAQYDNFEIQTADATSEGLFSINPASGAFSVFDVQVSCCSNDLSHCAEFSLKGCLTNSGGSLNVGQLNASTSIFSSDAGLAAALSVSGSNLVCLVNGLAGVDLRWSAIVKQCVCPTATP